MQSFKYTRSIAAPLNFIKRRLGIRFVIDRDPDLRKTIFLGGTARSGTTWVSDIINYRNEYRYIFEPFNYQKVPLVAPFGGRRYLRPDEQNDQLLDIARVILTGKIRSGWTERFNRRFLCDQRLIKEIRANLFLKWLHNNFPETPIVLLLRHPCAVAHSYEKQGWRASVDSLLAQESLVEDFLSPYKKEIEQVEDRFDKALMIWCIETMVPLKQFKKGELHIVFYENLIQEPEVEIKRLFSFLGKQYDQAAFGQLDKPSLTTRRDSLVFTSGDRIDGWRERVGEQRLHRALEIVKLFGLERIYSEASMPNSQAAFDLMEG